VLEIGGDLDLFGEAVGADDGGELGAEHLEGDLAVVLQVVGQVNGCHAAVAEFALDTVAVGEGRSETGGVGHGIEGDRAQCDARAGAARTARKRVAEAVWPQCTAGTSAEPDRSWTRRRGCSRWTSRKSRLMHVQGVVE
jgi:hypothetical protein